LFVQVAAFGPPQTVEPGERERRFDQGRQEAFDWEVLFSRRHDAYSRRIHRRMSEGHGFTVAAAAADTL
jgi:hypothetical protein